MIIEKKCRYRFLLVIVNPIPHIQPIILAVPPLRTKIARGSRWRIIHGFIFWDVVGRVMDLNLRCTIHHSPCSSAHDVLLARFSIVSGPLIQSERRVWVNWMVANLLYVNFAICELVVIQHKYLKRAKKLCLRSVLSSTSPTSSVANDKNE